MKIRPMTAEDWDSVSQIYAEGIATGFATFETQTPTFEHWDKAHISKCRFVAEEDGEIMGWVALSPVSSRCVYGGVGEVSVYIATKSRGKGVGKQLMQRLIEESEKAGYWTLQSGVFPENEASIKLHDKVGFRFIGKRERVGKIHGIWKDNLLFEKRSEKVGVD
ncbi:GNAT family N-acetyltransferase [Flagellimonas zhangzhouensis]|uniref:Phosphinothricin acetyltransferase n=1 Tax=Flagellimonas zhangzhouensis TaxID=1073328 RepID=A0A1H2U2K6_9FLAO|nr:GNAT family N-acetyltransferase [Allomuricauda zhangzhouensis]SDQ21042.1 phosphinothricin acetyltransferase [Allomuricauda zhangzhouensis]SDW50227.1 phosphinothricin acetyltransferase [Allomuricauda zhangzhouensis]